ncbi:hypothetical protein [Celerinatantimonas diazotrophica]|uniref:Uncharacterized protein n=1 Tax=Celerinatantimonas diazotrophica TaxID=412034 RepID=A0A4R1JLP5_9GAMM|nr:hypothetical protein [Celerinatantimonas diazotrophica]TCK51988.1 hypothetical protein EV690_2085 [Celerinatantimonas diazotrophica]CAG9296311.1 hypothetical protein CEDIAZO_01459 [Celerinatantimonas diazotrophica]
MGIGSDLMVKQAEEEHEEALYNEIILDAAIRIVVNEDSRKAAMDAAREFVQAQHDAIRQSEYDDVSNTIHFWNKSLNGIPMPKGKQESQVKAIARELKEQFPR